MSEIDPNAVPGDAPVDAPPVDAPVVDAPVPTPDPAPADVPADDPVVIAGSEPAVAAIASGDIEVSLIAFRGGPRDSTTGVLPGHDILSFETETGETYTRSDQQEGNFRVYTFTPPVGEAPDAVRVSEGVAIESKLEGDLAAIRADLAALRAAQGTPADDATETPAA